MAAAAPVTDIAAQDAPEDTLPLGISLRIGPAMKKMSVPPRSGRKKAWQYPLQPCEEFEFSCIDAEIGVWVHRSGGTRDDVEFYLTIVDHERVSELRVDLRPNKGYLQDFLLPDEDSIRVRLDWKMLRPKQVPEPMRFAVLRTKQDKSPVGLSQPFVFCTRRSLRPYYSCEH